MKIQVLKSTDIEKSLSERYTQSFNNIFKKNFEFKWAPKAGNPWEIDVKQYYFDEVTFHADYKVFKLTEKYQVYEFAF